MLEFPISQNSLKCSTSCLSLSLSLKASGPSNSLPVKRLPSSTSSDFLVLSIPFTTHPSPPPPLSSPESLVSGKMRIILNASCATSWVFASQHPVNVVQHHNHSHHNILTVVKYHRQHPQFVYDFLNVRKTTSWIQDFSIVSVLRTLPVRSAHFLLACLSVPSETFAWNFCFLNDATLRLTAELAKGETTCICWGAAWRSQYVRDSWYSEVSRSFVSARLSLLHNRKTTFSSLDHLIPTFSLPSQPPSLPVAVELKTIVYKTFENQTFKPSLRFYKMINPI